MSQVRVTLQDVADDDNRHLVNMPTVPRNGDYIVIEDQSYTVTGINYHVQPPNRRDYVGNCTKITVWMGKR